MAGTPLSDATNIDAIQLQEQASDYATPDAGYGRVYEKTDKQFYGRDSAGTVKRLSGLNVSVANITNPPTDAELDSAFGTPATVGAGYAAIVNDNNGDANNYLVVSNGTSWWYAALTKAT